MSTNQNKTCEYEEKRGTLDRGSDDTWKVVGSDDTEKQAPLASELIFYEPYNYSERRSTNNVLHNSSPTSFFTSSRNFSFYYGDWYFSSISAHNQLNTTATGILNPHLFESTSCIKNE